MTDSRLVKAQVRNSGDAHAEPGGLAVTGVLVGDVYLSRPAATARSSYRYQVEQVFPWTSWAARTSWLN
ncbi:hypothetical protein [Streptomyces canus]|uniref:Uncharacterized protein n=1 Tax=Streptomyces canus TaxID=58343 RepID=A0AAW8FUF6_9ACTN|nr:hypothetical protein [Streptomyces canus]MDQ0758986.1 hypothetical protein [Streptomyces canus]MDQ0912398.1 hypothetical protein [Streptomyces canus]MDQ1072384.1 hypothetical protein [Streptomyces canus]